MTVPEKLIAGLVHHVEVIGSKYLLLSLRMEQVYPQNPGQYCYLQLEDHFGTFQKPYSIASQPGTNKLVEFCLLKSSDPRTQEAMEGLKSGDKVYISAAKGRFHWPQPTTPATFIAGGSGIAPLRSMILSRFDKNHPSTSNAATRLLYGCEDAQQIPYFDELQKLADEHSEFQVTYYISHPFASTPHSSMQQGLPTAGLLATFPPNMEFFLCGPPPMMAAATVTLQQLGIGPERIFTDQY